MSKNIEGKFDTLIDHIIDIKSEQARQGEQIDRNTDDLKDHIEGVKQNRIRVENLEKRNERIKGVLKFLAVIGSICGAGAAVFGILSKII